MTSLKSSAILFVSLLFFVSGLNAQKNKKITSNIQQVTVYTQGAQVVRTAKTAIEAGTTDLVFTGISNAIDQQSVRVSGKGNFTIMSVKAQVNFLEQQKKSQEIKNLEAKISQLQAKRILEDHVLEVISSEERILGKNEAIGGQAGIKTAELKEAVEFHRQRKTALLKQRNEQNEKIFVIDTTVNNFRNQLNELRSKSGSETTDVVVTIKAQQDIANANFELTYYVSQAGWYANYDLRVQNVQSPLELVMKANVYQSSGEDWQNVKLLISNGNPTESGVVPRLLPWYLNFNSQNKSYLGNANLVGNTISGKVIGDGDPLPGASVLVKGTSIGTTTDFDGNFSIKLPNPNSVLVFSYVGFKNKEISPKSNRLNVVLEFEGMLEEVVVSGYNTKRAANALKGKAAGVIMEDQIVSVSMPSALAPETAISYQPTTIVYEIVELFTVKKDGKVYTAEIQRQQVPAIYQYVSVPKIESGAFLNAKITNWQDLNLLDGEINLFFEDTYQGKSLLDLSTSVDTLEISLGKDKGIVVERKPIKEFTATRFMSQFKTVSQGFEITVRNNKAYPVEVMVLDQLPIAQNKDITIEKEEHKDAKLNDEDKILTWSFNLNPRTEQKVQLKYQVKYPKNQRLVLD